MFATALFIHARKVVWWRPVAFLAVVSTPFVSLEVFRVAGKSVTLPYLCWLPAVIWGGIEVAKGKFPFRFGLLDRALWAWLAFGLAGAVFRWHLSPFDAFGIKTFTQAGYVIFCWVCMKCFVAFISEDFDRRMRFTVNSFLLTAAAVSIHGIVQIAAYHGFGIEFDFGRTANIYANQRGLLSVWAGGVFRACSFFPEPVFMATFLTCVLGFKLDVSKRSQAGTAALLTAAVALGMVLTLSRTAFAAIFAAVSIGFLLRFGNLLGRRSPSPPRSRPGCLTSSAEMQASCARSVSVALPILAAVFLSVAAIGLFVGENFEALSPGGDVSVVWRAVEVRDSMVTASRFPLFGLGFGNYDVLGSRHSFMGTFSRFEKPFTSSLYTRVLMEGGLFGFALFGLFCMACFLEALRFDAFNSNRISWFGTAGASAASLIMWCGHAAFNMTFWWIFLAILCSGVSKPHHENGDQLSLSGNADSFEVEPA